MTIKELRDLFYAQYSLQSQLRKMQKIEIADKMLSFFISAAQQDIQRRLSVVETSTTITLGTSSNLYALPQTFGKQKHAYVGGDRLEEKPIIWAEEQAVDGNDGYWYAIKISGHTPYIYCPISSGTLTIIYHPDLSYYQPSVSASQTWGTFDGVVYSGNLILPNRYNMAILYHILSQIFPDYLMMYEKELKSLRESRQFSDTNTLGYSLGGVEEDIRDRGTAIATSEEDVIVNALDQPSKRIRFTADDTGSYTVQYEDGWEVTPTIVNTITDPPSIVITSANNEFTNFVHPQITNENFGWSQTGATTITITPDPTSGWGEVEIIIDIYA
jgi:hypothetical protein